MCTSDAAKSFGKRHLSEIAFILTGYELNTPSGWFVDDYTGADFAKMMKRAGYKGIIVGVISPYTPAMASSSEGDPRILMKEFRASGVCRFLPKRMDDHSRRRLKRLLLESVRNAER